MSILRSYHTDRVTTSHDYSCQFCQYSSGHIILLSKCMHFPIALLVLIQSVRIVEYVKYTDKVVHHMIQSHKEG
jgi:hypothetical protein